MKALVPSLLLALCVGHATRGASPDSIVTFNEIMFHPATNEAAMEWVELYNQMSVDVDISNWRLDSGIDFTFPAGTIIRGRGHLVIAANPAALASATGLGGILGPFENRLGNAGETLQLKNNNGRLMDQVTYQAEADWPVAADGAGPSLAKVRATGTSDDPANWSASVEIGGTPGVRNVQPPGSFTAPPGLVSYWAFNETNTAILDLVGGNHGSAGAGVTRVTGLVGRGAFGFNGSPAAAIPVGAGVGNNFSVTDGLSIEAVLRPGWAGTGSAAIFRKEEPNPGALVAYWSFDEAATGTAAAVDAVGGNSGTFQGTASRTSGLAGTGAARFNNASADGVNVGTGVNNSFSMTTGITVFARFRLQWSGNSGDYDELFRKEDGGNRILLSFQNDSNNGGATPPVAGGPVLSFGLNVGGSYSELDMPLDGASGRPTLAQLKDGNIHSVAATYDAASGRKAIYIDGTLRWSAQLAGNIASGGGAAALIGNAGAGGGEPFTGVIDEVAVWRAALSAADIAGLAAGGNPGANGAGGDPAHRTSLLLAFQNDGNNGAANPPVPAGPVLSFGFNAGGTYSELDLPLDGQAGRPTLAQLQDGQTHHVAATYDRATGLKAIHIDGILLHSTIVTGAITSGGSAVACVGNVAAGGGEPFAGILDEVAFWNRSLTGTEVARHAAATQAGQDYFATTATTNREVFGFAAPWRFNQGGVDLGTAWRAPGFADAAWPEGPGLLAYETCGCLAEPIGTTLATNTATTTYYFRRHFSLPGNPSAATLSLRAFIDDGAVVFLNGTEIWRTGMPGGEATFGTFASRGVDNAILEGPVSIAVTSLLPGDNVLAVEVHQAAATSSDVVFGLALDTLETVFVPGGSPFATGERPRVVFNELASSTNSAFWVELYNPAASDLNLAGFVITRQGGTNREYVFPGGVLPAGGFLALTRETLGFSVDSGDRLILYPPGRTTVLDAVVAKKEPRARRPDGAGTWQFPSDPTRGATNEFSVPTDIVINEIMYHHRPIPATPAVYSPTNILINFTNRWRYFGVGSDPGPGWQAPLFNDAAWPAGPALLYVSPSTFPIAKHTPMPATNAAGVRINTYYFRTAFDFPGSPAGALLSLRGIIDDGAVFYLNGVEVHRQNLPATDISYATFASSSIGVAGFSGPVVLPATALVTGRNVLAVEVHRVSSVDSDAVFAAELSASSVITPAQPFRESPESWVELFNRGGTTVDLAGWRLDEGISFRFATNTPLAPGAFLVVARDVAHLTALHPAIDIVGPFNGQLSKSSDRLVLRDAAGNVADEVRYFDGGHWPESANGGGSSLELRDPWADNSRAGAWAASDEARNSTWVSFTNRAVAAGSPQPATAYQELVIGLLDAGECLIDDIRVVESPTNTPVSLVSNGNFNTGITSWRIVGNHYGAIEPDPTAPANSVLHLTATGPTEYLHNHAEITLKNGASSYTIINGRQYEVSFRAKWISGNNLLNTRLWMNRVPRTFELAVPAVNGTPGATNSRYTANLGPTFAGFAHSRTVPAAGEPVTVTACAGDPQGLASARLWWRAGTQGWSNAPMNLGDCPPSAATLGDAGISYAGLTGTIPGLPAGTIVQFHVAATDTLGATSFYPPGGPASRALYQVDDGQAQPSLAHNLRIVMSPQDNDLLFQSTNLMSNGRMGATVLWDEGEAYYDAGVRLKGSEHGRPDGNRLGFFLDFRPDDLFRGVHSSVGIDRSGGWRFGTTFGQDEIVIKHVINHAGGLPGMYDDLIRVIAPRSQYTGPAIMQMARYGDVFLESQYENGGDGTVFEYELLYDASATTTGGPEGFKLPQESGVVGVPLGDLGADKENYRLDFIIKNNRGRDDYTGLITALKAIGQPAGAGFDTATARALDVDEWLRAYAACSLTGPADNYGGDNAQHNLQLYTRPSDGRTLFFIWDTDFAFYRPSNAGIADNTELQKFITNPANRRRYYCHLLDIITTTYNPTYMAYWTDHYDNFLPGQNFSSILTYISQRSTFVLSQLPLNIPFAITNNGGNNFSTASNSLRLAGTAPLTIKGLEVNGVYHPVTWTSVSNWFVTVALAAGNNTLNVQGIDLRGNRVTNVVDVITVTNTGTGSLLPVVINEWMADNDGPGGVIDVSDGTYGDWFELYNPNAVAIPLGGFTLTDDPSQPAKFTIPAGTSIAAGGFLLVWADEDSGANSPTNQDFHVNFRLSSGGENLSLISTSGVVQSQVVFGSQSRNISQGRFPDGDTNSLHFMTNWTPRAANRIDAPATPVVGSVSVDDGGVLHFTCGVQAGRTYQVEYTENFGPAAWLPLGEPVRATGSTLDFVDPATGPRRFYRVTLLP